MPKVNRLVIEISTYVPEATMLQLRGVLYKILHLLFAEEVVTVEITD